MIWVDTIVQGVLLGGLYALFAAGLSLVFGIMRLVNLAHGDLIVMAAYLILILVTALGLHPFLAAAVAAPLMFAVGWGLQRVVLSRTLGTDILPPLLVTFGMSIVIQNALLEGFSADSQRISAGALETASVDLGPVTVGLMPLLTFASAVLVIVGLNWLLYRTALGRAFRATSDDPVTARLMGIDPGRVFATATGLALVVATIAALYLGVRANFDPAIGPARLIYAFEAVIIGGLGSLWGTLAGGVIIGVAQTLGAAINPEWQILAGHIAFLVVLAVRPRGLFPEGGGLMSWRVQTRTQASRIAGVAAVALVAAAVALPAFAGRGLVQDLFFILTMLVLAQFWNLLAGYGGLVSVGQQAFVGIGAYAMFGAVILWGWDPVLAIPLGGLAAVALAVPTAFFAFRLAGAYFAIGTWVIAEVARLSVAQWKTLGGGTGTSLPRDATANMLGVDTIAALFDVRAAAARDILAYWLALALAVATVGGIYWLLRHRQGLALAAVRDDAEAAGAMGVDARRMKWRVFLIAAFGTGVTGALIYVQTARISPDAAFSVVDWTAYVIFIVVIGGIGTIEGPIIGVLVFFALQSVFADYGSWYLLGLGLIAIVVMLVAPGGLWGLFADRTGIQLFPVRRRLTGTMSDTSRTTAEGAPHGRHHD